MSKFVWFGGAAERGKGIDLCALVAEAVKGEAQSTHVRGFGLITGDMQNGYDTQEINGGWEVYNPIVYAPFVEFGTQHMPAQAHLRNAAQRIVAANPQVKWVSLA